MCNHDPDLSFGLFRFRPHPVGTAPEIFEPPSQAVVVPLHDCEMALLRERAAAHRMGIVDFVRLCSLTLPTALETNAVHGFGGAT